MRAAIGLLCTLALAAALIALAIRWYDFKTGCGDYLKLAGDAPTVERAHGFLTTAIAYVDDRGLTNGNSAFFLHTPKNDLRVWSGQLRGGCDTLAGILEREAAVPGSVSQLEQDNALMKLREVLLDQGSSGTKLTLPDNITVYPDQIAFLFGVLLLVVATVGTWAWVLLAL
jgi:hypothetical protein